MTSVIFGVPETPIAPGAVATTFLYYLPPKAKVIFTVHQCMNSHIQYIIFFQCDSSSVSLIGCGCHGNRLATRSPRLATRSLSVPVSVCDVRLSPPGRQVRQLLRADGV